jgi:serine/threonine protein phosphatase PrpC
MKTAVETAAGNPENQDRGAVIDSRTGLVLVVADGAGGRRGGKEAAVMAVELVRQKANELLDADSCVTLLQSMDQSISRDKAAGETTCAVAVVTEGEVYGASVGDSGVWSINESGFVNLTERQSRKPFIGSASAWPLPFECKRTSGGFLLLATDGLLKYTSSDRIIAAFRAQDPSEIARKLIELVRYSSGALPDDTTVIVAKL